MDQIEIVSYFCSKDRQSGHVNSLGQVNRVSIWVEKFTIDYFHDCIVDFGVYHWQV
jgi:hypothetical protein